MVVMAANENAVGVDVRLSEQRIWSLIGTDSCCILTGACHG